MIIPQDLINEAKERLGTKAAIEIANDLGLKQFDERNLKALCYWHKEDTPSLSWHTKGNYWNCFGCGQKYDIIDHYMSFYSLSFIEAAKMLFEKTGTSFDGLEDNVYDENFFEDYKYPKEETGKERDKVEEYLQRRGISKATLDYADIKQDRGGNIVFEHRDINGKLLCTKYRNRESSVTNKARTWWQKYSSTCPILYGIDKIDTTKPLLIVEGHIDRLSCIEAGYLNTVSIPHGAGSLGWIDFNWSYLDSFESIKNKHLKFLGANALHIKSDNSLFMLSKMVAGTANLTLREHFRCVPEIIEFSKFHFYDNSLRPLKQINSNRLNPKETVFVNDAFTEDKIVYKEIEEIKKFLQRILKDEQYSNKSIGVVSLGLTKHTEKLKDIKEDLANEFGKEKIDKHKLIIEDSPKFQGDERDVMIVSLGVALDFQKLKENQNAKPRAIISDQDEFKKI